MYYKTKLQLHNFKFHVWNEADGGVTSNEFTTCIIDFIDKIDNTKLDQVTHISDGCVYQNRKKVLVSAFKKNITITQLFLTKRHTMTGADSVHSTLEQLFNPPLFSPFDYVAKMRSARPKHPYIVNQVILISF